MSTLEPPREGSTSRVALRVDVDGIWETGQFLSRLSYLQFSYRRLGAFYSPRALDYLRRAPDAVSRARKRRVVDAINGETVDQPRYQYSSQIREAARRAARDIEPLTIRSIRISSPGFIEQLGSVVGLRALLDFFTALRTQGTERLRIRESTKIGIAREVTIREALRHAERIQALDLMHKSAELLDGADRTRAAKRVVARAEEIVKETPRELGEEFILYSLGEPMERIARLADDPRVVGMTELQAQVQKRS